MWMRVILYFFIGVFGTGGWFSVWSQVQGDLSKRIALLTPSKKTLIVFNNQLALIGYDVFADGLKLSNTDSQVVLKKGKPFNIRYYWQYIDFLNKEPSFHALFSYANPIQTTHGASHRFASAESLWQNVTTQEGGELIGHTFFEEHTYVLPDQYLMWEPGLVLRLNDTNYQGVLSLKFDDVIGAFQYGKQYLNQGNIENALTEFVAFSERADTTHMAYLQDMLSLFQKHTLQTRSDWRVVYCLGHVARVAQNWAKSADYFFKAVRLNDSVSDAYFYAAHALIAQNKSKQAVSWAQNGLRIDPENVFLRGVLAHLTDQENYPAYRFEGDWRGMTPNGYLSSHGAVWQKWRAYGGNYQFRVQLRGVPAGDVWPHVIIQINGKNVYEDDVRSRDSLLVEIDHTLQTGEHWMAIWFTNNVTRTNAQGQVEDADLYVEKCEIVHR